MRGEVVKRFKGSQFWLDLSGRKINCIALPPLGSVLCRAVRRQH
jgi:hypothetical protein